MNLKSMMINLPRPVHGQEKGAWDQDSFFLSKDSNPLSDQIGQRYMGKCSVRNFVIFQNHFVL